MRACTLRDGMKGMERNGKETEIVKCLTQIHMYKSTCIVHAAADDLKERRVQKAYAAFRLSKWF